MGVWMLAGRRGYGSFSVTEGLLRYLVRKGCVWLLCMRFLKPNKR
jgi:hypothetical protein